MSHLNLPYLTTIPYAVSVNPNLTPLCKIFYGSLVGLSVKEGYCWASNEQLAEMAGVKRRAIVNYLAALEKEGFISRETCNKPHKNINSEFFWKRERKIFITNGFSNSSYDRAQTCSIDRAQTCPSYDRAQTCPVNIEISKEDKKEKYIKRKFGSYVEFSEQEYEDLVKNHGKEKVDSIVESINDYCTNNRPKGYKDYSGAFRTFLKKMKEREGNRINTYQRLYENSTNSGRFVCKADSEYVCLSDDELRKQGRLIE